MNKLKEKLNSLTRIEKTKNLLKDHICSNCSWSVLYCWVSTSGDSGKELHCYNSFRNVDENDTCSLWGYE